MKVYRNNWGQWGEYAITGILGYASLNCTNLTIKSESQLKDYNAKSRLSDREWRSGEESKRLFFAGRTPDDVIYDSHYKISEYGSNSFISKNDYLNIISDYDGAVERFARRWIENNQESIFVDFLVNDDIKGHLQDIIDDKENPLHYIRAIINSVKDTDCKTVNVTIIKDGKELTFKTDADVMKRDCGSYYGTHHMDEMCEVIGKDNSREVTHYLEYHRTCNGTIPYNIEAFFKAGYYSDAAEAE